MFLVRPIVPSFPNRVEAILSIDRYADLEIPHSLPPNLHAREHASSWRYLISKFPNTSPTRWKFYLVDVSSHARVWKDLSDSLPPLLGVVRQCSIQ